MKHRWFHRFLAISVFHGLIGGMLYISLLPSLLSIPVISYMEIYNEKVRDLLQVSAADKSQQLHKLKVREHPKEGPYVESKESPVCRIWCVCFSCMLIFQTWVDIMWATTNRSGSWWRSETATGVCLMWVWCDAIVDLCAWASCVLSLVICACPVVQQESACIKPGLWCGEYYIVYSTAWYVWL